MRRETSEFVDYEIWRQKLHSFFRRTLTRWGLTVLESCERPSRNVLSIHFNTMRSDKRQRHYLFAEEKDCLVSGGEKEILCSFIDSL